MDTRGGFELPREGAPALRNHGGGGEEDAAEAVAITQPDPPLTDRQQTRLSAYLDNALTRLSRGYLRRHEPRRRRREASPSSTDDADWLPTLPAFLSAWAHVLGLIVRIPPAGSSAALLVSYLLRTTAELTEDMTGYNLGEDQAQEVGRGEEDGKTAARQLSLDEQLPAALRMLDALDHIWADLLRGLAIKKYQAHLNQLVYGAGAVNGASEPPPTGLATDPSGRFHHAPSSHRTTLLHSFPPPPNTPHRPPSSSSSSAILSQTERIRLRNLAFLARDRLFRWMRDVLDAPPPPEVQEYSRGQDSDGQNGDPDRLGALGHGSRVAALLGMDERGLPASKRRRTGPSGPGGKANGGSTHHPTDSEATALDEQEREFAELAGEQGDLDAGLGELKDEPVDEADDDGHVEVAGGQEHRQEDEDIPQMIDVVDEEDEGSPVRSGGRPGPRDDHLNGGGVAEEGGQLGEEHRHYADLFSRKLDPDASDDEDNDEASRPHDAPAGRRGEHDEDAHGFGTKRQRERQRSGSISSTEARTIDPTDLTDHNGRVVSHTVLGQWDLEFSRCFRRTLRLLAEQEDWVREQERQRQGEGQEGQDGELA